MYMSNNANLILGGFVIFMLFLYLVFPHIIYSAWDKVRSDKHDSELRKKNGGVAFMQSGRLADRYRGLSIVDSNVEKSNIQVVKEKDFDSDELKFCPYCGADLSQMEADDIFCNNCGSKLR